MNMLLAVACGGAVGAISRHLISNQVMRWAYGGFPWGTLIVSKTLASREEAAAA
mgnify:CR=1 FL=1